MGSYCALSLSVPELPRPSVSSNVPLCWLRKGYKCAVCAHRLKTAQALQRAISPSLYPRLPAPFEPLAGPSRPLPAPLPAHARARTSTARAYTRPHRAYGGLRAGIRVPMRACRGLRGRACVRESEVYPRKCYPILHLGLRYSLLLTIPGPQCSLVLIAEG